MTSLNTTSMPLDDHSEADPATQSERHNTLLAFELVRGHFRLTIDLPGTYPKAIAFPGNF
jgi:hypothetical protein